MNAYSVCWSESRLCSILNTNNRWPPKPQCSRPLSTANLGWSWQCVQKETFSLTRTITMTGRNTGGDMLTFVDFNNPVRDDFLCPVWVVVIAMPDYICFTYNLLHASRLVSCIQPHVLPHARNDKFAIFPGVPDNSCSGWWRADCRTCSTIHIEILNNDFKYP